MSGEEIARRRDEVNDKNERKILHLASAQAQNQMKNI